MRKYLYSREFIVVIYFNSESILKWKFGKLKYIYIYSIECMRSLFCVIGNMRSENWKIESRNSFGLPCHRFFNVCTCMKSWNNKLISCVIMSFAPLLNYLYPTSICFIRKRKLKQEFLIATGANIKFGLLEIDCLVCYFFNLQLWDFHVTRVMHYLSAGYLNAKLGRQIIFVKTCQW